MLGKFWQKKRCGISRGMVQRWNDGVWVQHVFFMNGFGEGLLQDGPVICLVYWPSKHLRLLAAVVPIWQDLAVPGCN